MTDQEIRDYLDELFGTQDATEHDKEFWGSYLNDPPEIVHRSTEYSSLTDEARRYIHMATRGL